MLITRTSTYSGLTRTMDLDITEDQIKELETGIVIQKAMPNLTDDEREFYISGITSEEWDELFPEDDNYFEDEPAF